MQHNLTIDVFGISLRLLLKIMCLIGKCRHLNGTWKTQVNGKQKILISSSTKLRRKNMIEKCKAVCCRVWDKVKAGWNWIVSRFNR
jgi:hypothetical protein